MPASEPPQASETREYLLEGALFDERPKITAHHAADGRFERMELRYDSRKVPMVLRRLHGEDVEAARGEAIDVAMMCGCADVAAAIEACALVLEWEVERAELDSDAWFALHLWQAFVLGPSRGWLYAPDDGVFDAELQRRCAES